MAFLHEHIILPLSDMLQGEQVHKYLRVLKDAENWTPVRMEAFQQERLRKLITYAATEVPFYRDWFLNQHLDPSTATLNELPIVSFTLDPAVLPANPSLSTSQKNHTLSTLLQN